MPAQLETKLGERPVTVRELTVTEVRNWVAEHEAGAVIDPLRSFVFDDCSLDDMARQCDITADDMEAYAPSDLTELRDKCKALNPHFFKVREALTGVSRMMQAELDSLSSTAPSQP